MMFSRTFHSCLSFHLDQMGAGSPMRSLFGQKGTSFRVVSGTVCQEEQKESRSRERTCVPGYRISREEGCLQLVEIPLSRWTCLWVWHYMLSLSAILRSPRVHGCSKDIKTAFAVYSFEVNKCTEVSRSSREDCSHDSPALFLSSSSLVCYTFVYLSHVMLIWCLCSFLLSITHSFHSKRDDKTLDSYENPRKNQKRHDETRQNNNKTSTLSPSLSQRRVVVLLNQSSYLPASFFKSSLHCDYTDASKEIMNRV